MAEAARNLACSGAIPVAITDNLNFGNPHKPENFWQLRECVEGLAEGCRAFGTPVTGGNVSLYNENPTGAIDPTPTVGMVGLIADERHVTTQWFKAAGDVVILVTGATAAGGLGDELGGSHYLKVVHGRKEGRVPRVNFEREKAMHDALRALITAGIVKSAHDCSEGGVAVALAECCISCPELQVGATIELGNSGLRLDQALFNESQARVVISTAADRADEALAALAQRGVGAIRLGTTGGDALKIQLGADSLSWSLAELHDRWFHSIARVMHGEENPLVEAAE
jgi:phosphoribosylformylglycinamidine synthase